MKKIWVTITGRVRPIPEWVKNSVFILISFGFLIAIIVLVIEKEYDKLVTVCSLFIALCASNIFNVRAEIERDKIFSDLEFERYRKTLSLDKKHASYYVLMKKFIKEKNVALKLAEKTNLNRVDFDNLQQSIANIKEIIETEDLYISSTVKSYYNEFLSRYDAFLSSKKIPDEETEIKVNRKYAQELVEIYNNIQGAIKEELGIMEHSNPKYPSRVAVRGESMSINQNIETREPDKKANK